jgi:hypothetical protein
MVIRLILRLLFALYDDLHANSDSFALYTGQKELVQALYSSKKNLIKFVIQVFSCICQFFYNIPVPDILLQCGS